MCDDKDNSCAKIINRLLGNFTLQINQIVTVLPTTISAAFPGDPALVAARVAAVIAGINQITNVVQTALFRLINADEDCCGAAAIAVINAALTAINTIVAAGANPAFPLDPIPGATTLGAFITGIITQLQLNLLSIINSCPPEQDKDKDCAPCRVGRSCKRFICKPIIHVCGCPQRIWPKPIECSCKNNKRKVSRGGQCPI